IARASAASSPTATSFADAVAGRASDEPLEQEGALRRGAADVAHRDDERGVHQADDQDLVAYLDDLPRDGRAQARRVRAHTHLPRSCRVGEGSLAMASEEETPGAPGVDSSAGAEES